MKEVDYIVYGDYLLTGTVDIDLILNGAVAVKGEKIIEVGTFDVLSKKYTAKKKIGGEGIAIFPGLINTHTHAPMVYFRGYADDIPFKDWLEKYIWPAESKWLSQEFVSDATKLACLEMINAGVTTYNDMYFFEEESAQSVKEIGIRAVLGKGVLDFASVVAKTVQEYIDNAEEFIRDFSGDDLILPAIAPHAPYTCAPDTYKKAKKLSEKYNIPLHTHLSETEWEVKEIKKRYGKPPIEHLDSLGILDSSVLAVHCVWPSDKEIRILASKDVGVSHCVISNLKLSSGISPVVKMQNEGVKVSFGTDSAASNNNLDVLSEMGIAARLHKVISNDPTALEARQAFYMATRIGAEVLGLGHKAGTIENGKAADIVIANLKKPHLTPIYNIYSHIVYSMRASDIDTVMVNGKIVLENRRLTNKSEEEILDRANWWRRKISNP